MSSEPAKELIAQLTERINAGGLELTTINLYKRIRGCLQLLMTHGFK